MDLRELKIFLNLTETLHFASTAQQMNVSPSALTRIVQRMEQETGQPLFARDNRSVQLTSAGQRLQDFAQQTINHWQQTQQQLQTNSNELSGELKLFCTVTASYSFLPSILDKFRHLHPHVEIKLSTGDAVEAIDMVLNNQVEVAFAIKPEAVPRKLAFETIGSVPLSIIAPAGMPSDSWFQSPIIIPERGPTKDAMESWYRQQMIQPDVYARVGGHEAIVSMVALGFGIGIAPTIVVNSSPMADRVKIINSTQQIEPLELGVCCQQANLTMPIVKAFLNLATTN